MSRPLHYFVAVGMPARLARPCFRVPAREAPNFSAKTEKSPNDLNVFRVYRERACQLHREAENSG